MCCIINIITDKTDNTKQTLAHVNPKHDLSDIKLEKTHLGKSTNQDFYTPTYLCCCINGECEKTVGATLAWHKCDSPSVISLVHYAAVVVSSQAVISSRQYDPPKTPTFTSGSRLVPKCATIRSTAVFTAFTKPDKGKQGKNKEGASMILFVYKLWCLCNECVFLNLLCRELRGIAVSFTVFVLALYMIPLFWFTKTATSCAINSWDSFLGICVQSACSAVFSRCWSTQRIKPGWSSWRMITAHYTKPCCLKRPWITLLTVKHLSALRGTWFNHLLTEPTLLDNNTASSGNVIL